MTRYLPYSLEAQLKYQEGDSQSITKTAQDFAGGGLHLWAAGLYLWVSDPRAETEFAKALASPVWVKYWVDSYQWMYPEEIRNGELWQAFRESLGYTDGWRLEVCRRVSTLPPRSGLSCDPELEM
jgi:hypothetical protein